MNERQSVINVMQERFRKARKKQMRRILDECCMLTGYNRSYASHLLSYDRPAIERQKQTQNQKQLTAAIGLPPAVALSSLSCVALSSEQARQFYQTMR